MEITILFLSLGLALVIGAIGRHRNIGFFFAFLWSILLSPIIGLAITLASRKKVDDDELNLEILDQISRLNSLKEKGVIDDIQFEYQKLILNDKMQNRSNSSSKAKWNHIIALIIFIIVLVILLLIGLRWANRLNQKQELEAINDSSSKIEKPVGKIEESGYGYVSGSMYYPGEGVPDYIKLVFFNIDTKEATEIDNSSTDSNYSYKIKLPVGKYYVYETGLPDVIIFDEDNETSGKEMRSYYTQFCNGGKSHKKKIVVVQTDKTVKNVIPCDEEYQ